MNMMMLGIHILTAVISVVLIAVTAFLPSNTKIKMSGVTVGITIFSGLALILVNPMFVKQVCISGIGYLGFVTGAAFLIRRNKLWKNIAGTSN